MRIAIEAQRLVGRQSGVGGTLRGLTQGLRAQETGNGKRETGSAVQRRDPLSSGGMRNEERGTSGRTPNSELRAPGHDYSFVISGLGKLDKSKLPRHSVVLRLFLPKKVVNGLRKVHLFPPLNWLVGHHDVYFFPDFVRWPLSRNKKSVVYIHDLAYVHYPQFIEPKNLKYLKKFVPRSVNKADHIVTNSEYSKQDIIKHFGLSEKKVSVVNPAVDSGHFKPQTKKEIKRVRNKLKLPEKFILFVGNIEPRKNIEGLMKAYGLLPQPLRNKYPLVLAGAEGWQNTALSAAIKNSSDVLALGYVADNDMPGLYSAATVFVLPSHFEGFGLPVLEAMASGTPVACSDNSSLPEVAGRNAVLFDSSSSGDIKNKLEELLKDNSLRNKLSKSGIKQAKKFSWIKSAERLVKILETTAKG